MRFNAYCSTRRIGEEILHSFRGDLCHIVLKRLYGPYTRLYCPYNDKPQPGLTGTTCDLMSFALTAGSTDKNGMASA